MAGNSDHSIYTQGQWQGILTIASIERVMFRVSLLNSQLCGEVTVAPILYMRETRPREITSVQSNGAKISHLSPWTQTYTNYCYTNNQTYRDTSTLYVTLGRRGTTIPRWSVTCHRNLNIITFMEGIDHLFKKWTRVCTYQQKLQSWWACLQSSGQSWLLQKRLQRVKSPHIFLVQSTERKNC